MNSKCSLILRCAALLAGLCLSHCSQPASEASDLGAGDLAAFDLVPPPPVLGLTAVTPSLIPMESGIQLVIEGSLFADGATVTIAGVLATQTVVVSDTRITTVTPSVPLSPQGGPVPVVVTNPDGQTVSRSDLLTYYVDKYLRTFTTGSQPIDIAVGDFDGDGNADFATANYDGRSVSVRFGNGRASFPRGTDLPLNASGFALAVADFNRDGRTDIVVSALDGMSNISNVNLILGAQVDSLNATLIEQYGQSIPMVLAVGDWNNDGLMDLDNSAYGSNLIRLGDGTGKFALPTGCALAGGGEWVAAGDLNGDGAVDLISEDLQTIHVCIGDGTGKFTRRYGPDPSVGNSRGTNSARMIDLNGDHKDDLILVSSGKVSISFNDGMGNFLPSVSIAVSGTATRLAVVDLNGDGNLDLAVPEASPNQVHILLGDGTGKFTEDQVIALGQSPWAVAVGDFNGDRKPDLAFANVMAYPVTDTAYATIFGPGNSVSILLNPY